MSSSGLRLTEPEAQWLSRVLSRKAEIARRPEVKKSSPSLSKTIITLCNRLTKGEHEKINRKELRVIESLVDNHLQLLGSTVIPEYEQRLQRPLKHRDSYETKLAGLKHLMVILQELRDKTKEAL